MFCSQCGAQNNDGASFCVACGAPMKKVTPPQGQQFTQIPTPPQYGQQPQQSGSFGEMINDLKMSLTTPGGLLAFILSRFNVIAIGGALLMFIGLFPNFVSASVYGLKIGAALIKGGDGVLVLIVSLICICAGLLGMHKTTIACAAVNLLIIFIDIADISGSLDVGAGFVLILLGGLATIAGSVMGIMYAKQGKKLPLQK